MSKKLFALVLSLSMVMTMLLAGCSAQNDNASTPPEGSDAPTTESTAPTGGDAEGRVYWLNFKPESDQVLNDVAKMYTEKTGVPVKIVTAASGTYSQTLNAEMSKSEAPTIFNVGNAAGVRDWTDYALDLNGTPIANELNTDAYNLYDETGKLVSIGYCYECFGIIVNPDLLEQAGLNCGTENCWAINSKVSEADQQATMEFMVWCVTDPEASRMLVDTFGVMPYKNAAESTNSFLAAANEYSNNGCYVMNWAFNYQPNVDELRAGMVSALNAYNADQSDANWENVCTAFVDGWAAQYAAVN